MAMTQPSTRDLGPEAGGAPYQRFPLSRRRRHVLFLCYRLGSPTVADLCRALGLHYKSIWTCLQILLRQGYVSVQRQGGANSYRPTQPREAVLRAEMERLAETLGSGFWEHFGPIARELLGERRGVGGEGTTPAVRREEEAP